MRRATAINLLALSLLAGLIAGRAGIRLSSVAVLGLLAVPSLIAWRRRRIIGLALALAAAAGLWRADAWLATRGQLTSLVGQTVAVTGIVLDDPARSATGQVNFTLGHLELSGHHLAGELSVHEYPVQVQRGYRLSLSGPVKPGFGPAVAELSFPKLTVLSTHQDWLERLRQRFFAGMKTALTEPAASFGLGLLVGIRALIPKSMQTELALVGLSHLVAVSGYNLTIIVQAVDRLLQRLGRGLAAAVSLWLIAGFLVVTGASASIVRASLVSVLSLLAGLYGRRFQPMTLILLAAATTAVYDPKYLTDLGWLLSFLAFYGILVLAPAIETQLGHPKPIIARLAIESTAAQLLTLPLILYFFGQLSIVAPLTNLIILPFVPVAMATSFLAGLAGMIVPPFAGWLAWPAQMLLNFIIKIIDGFAALPWAGRTEHITFAGMMAMYGCLLVLSLVLQRARAHTRPDHAAATTIASRLSFLRQA